uniref:RNA-directed RNA polymerase n=1 Tax=Picornavirales sp. TaxID=1955153 RepID=A0A6M3YNT8_9VIRU|nr:MAG: hypothetical protein 1 [Picornavirales sp.]
MVKDATENPGKSLSPKQERAALRRRTEESIRVANTVLNRCHSMIEQTVMRSLSSNKPVTQVCSQATLSWVIEEFLEDEGYEEYALTCLGNHDRTGRLCFVAFYDKMGAKKAFFFEFDASSIPGECLYMVSQGHILDVHLDDFPRSDTNHDLEIYRDRVFRARSQIDFVTTNNLAYDYIRTKLWFDDSLGRLRLCRVMQSQGFCLVCKTESDAKGFHVTRNNVAHSYKTLDTLERCAEAFGYEDIYKSVMKEFKHSQGSPKIERLREPLCQPRVRTHQEIAKDLVKLLKEAVNPVILQHAPPVMKSQFGLGRIKGIFQGISDELKNKPREFIQATMHTVGETLTEEFKDYIRHVGADWWLWFKECLLKYALIAIPVVIILVGYVRFLMGIFSAGRGKSKSVFMNLASGMIIMKVGTDILKFAMSFTSTFCLGVDLKTSVYYALARQYNDKSSLVTTLSVLYSQVQAWYDRFLNTNNINDEGIHLDEETLVAQSGLPDVFKIPDFDMDTLKNGIGSMFGLISLTTLGKQPDAKGYKDFLQSIGSLPRAVDGTMKLYEYLQSVLQKAINWVRRRVLGDDRLHYANIGMPDIDEWCSQVVAMHRSALMSELEINDRNYLKVYNLHIGGLKFANNPRLYGDSARVRTILQEYGKVVRELLVPFKNANVFGVKPRMEPVTVYLAGEPGVGKSVLVIPFVLKLLARVLKPSQLEELEANYNNFFYCRQTEHEFWDRYYGQMVTIFDDFLQRRDTEQATASEAMELIRISSMFPNILHMAALEQKGTTVFNSEIIVLTSNFTSLSSVVSIQSREALRRRFTLTYALVPKREFCTPATQGADLAYTERRLNRAAFAENEVRFDAHEFHELRWNENNEAVPTGRVLSFDETISEVEDVYAKRVATFENYSAGNKHLIDQGVAEARAREHVFQFTARQAAETREEERMRSQSGNVDDEIPLFDIFEENAGVEEEVPVVTLADFDASDSDSDEESIEEQLSAFPVLDEDVVFPRLRTRDYFYTSLKPSQVVFLYCCSLGKKATDIFYLAQQGCVDARKNLVRVVNKATSTDAGRRAFCLAAFTTKEFGQVVDLPKLERMQLQLKSWMAQLHLKIQTIWANPLIKGLTAFGSAVSMCWIMYSGYKKFFPRNIMQSGEARKNRPRRENVKASRLARMNERQLPATWHSQGGIDLNAHSLARRLAAKSCYRIRMEGFEQTLGHCLFVRGRIMLTFSHLRDSLVDMLDNSDIDEETFLYFENKSLSYKVSVGGFLDLNHHFLIQKDVMLIEMPNMFHQHTDLTDHFIDRSLVNGHVDWTVGIGGYRSAHHFGEYISIGKYKKSTVHYGGGKEYHVDDVLAYDAPTVSGDCGSVCILHNKAVQGKIVGIHICGSGTRGESAIVTCQLLKVALENFEGDALVFPPLKGEPASDKAPDLGRGIVPAMQAQAAVICRRSKIIPSKLHSAWGPATTAPAILDYVWENGVRIDPMFDNLSRYCKNEVVMDQGLVEAVASNIASKFYNLSQFDRDKREILTFEQAVEGVPGAKYYEPIDRKSSPGYPWKNDVPPGYPGKSWWLGSGEEKPPYDSPQTKHLRATVEGIIADARKGIRRDHIFLDFPKDERRSLKKIAQKKTRSISGAPMDLSIAMKMYFGPFAAFVMRTRLHNGCAVGINARSEEWGDLAAMLREFKKHFDGDYEGFDTLMTSLPLWFVVHIINCWFNDSEENQRIRRVLWASVVNSLHIYGVTIYQWIMANPSGNILTVILNCIVNLIYMQGCYALLHPMGQMALPFFYEDVVCITYGDDNIVGVSDRAAPFFNQITVAKALKAFGQKYTDSEKNEPTEPFRPFEVLTFLKRGFRFEKSLRPPQWVAPLTLDTITEMPYWTKQGCGEDDITKSNAAEALIELSLHGQETFNRVGKEIIDACKERLNWMPERSTFQACIDFAMTHEVIY